MYSLVSNCKGGLNCVFGKFHHPFCCITAHGIAGAKLVSNWERDICHIRKVCKFYIVKDIHVNTLGSVIFDT